MPRRLTRIIPAVVGLGRASGDALAQSVRWCGGEPRKIAASSRSHARRVSPINGWDQG